MRSRMGRILLFGIMAGLGLGLPAATGWYAGVETGSDWGTFRPYYTGGFPGETPAQYRNHGQGLEIGAVVGHEWQVAPPFSLGVQGRIATARAVWEVFFTESEVSFLKYQLGDAFALSVLPAVRLGSRLWLQGEAGWGMTMCGNRRLRSTTRTTSTTSGPAASWWGPASGSR
ncbi:MAG TPA: hypothetical protein PKK12_13050 [Candidatus Aminicenantes bacterium]|nr:hypothetical protein [Candidatus Aminicenantes bacterium]